VTVADPTLLTVSKGENVELAKQKAPSEPTGRMYTEVASTEENDQEVAPWKSTRLPVDPAVPNEAPE
jgi:hypothetical protein